MIRAHRAFFAAISLLAVTAPAAAQDRVRVSVNVGQQTTNTTFSEEQPFQQYFEQGSFTLERTIPKRLFYDGGVAVRVAGGFHMGATISYLTDDGTGRVTAQVPHPLFFNQPRAVSGDAQNVARTEIGQHIQLSWTAPAAGGIEFTFFGGPSIFSTEQVFVKALRLSLSSETYPYDTLAFPGVTTETLKENVIGYNAGVDLTWKATPRVGVGLLIRYAHGTKDFTPTGGQAASVEVGGLHAGGGLRVSF